MVDTSAYLNLVKRVEDLHPVVTNLCTDPKPTNYENWVGGPGGGTWPTGYQMANDTTHADGGFYLSFDHGSGGDAGWLVPNGNGLVVDTNSPGISFVGPLVGSYQLEDLTFRVLVKSPPGAMDLALDVECFDATGTYLTTASVAPRVIDGAQTVAAGGELDYRASIVASEILAAEPTTQYVTFTLIVDPQSHPLFVNQKSYYGSCMVTPTEGSGYGDGDTPGWSTESDGTSSGPAPVLTSWPNVANKPDVITGLVGTLAQIDLDIAGKAPLVHTHDAADIVSGVLDQDRLGSGSSGAGTKILYDDSTWDAPPPAGLTSAMQVDSYTTAQSATTWTKPAGAIRCTFEFKAAGAGGGSGRKGAAATARAGGLGGGAGGRILLDLPASAVPSSLYVWVGAGGTGGTGQATNSTAGITGADGAPTFISTSSSATLATARAAALAYASGGQGGPGGTAATTSTGGAAGHNNAGSGSGSSVASGASPAFLGGGGAGGVITTGNAILAAGGSTMAENNVGNAIFGAVNDPPSTVGGSPGIDASTIAAMTHGPQPGLGGTGGVGSTTGAGGKGGNGIYGGGGGGGGPSTDSVGTSGAGGDGGTGYLVITTYF